VLWSLYKYPIAENFTPKYKEDKVILQTLIEREPEIHKIIAQRGNFA